MSMILQNRDGVVTEIDGKTGEILAKKEDASTHAEVEALIDHMNGAGLFVPKGGVYRVESGRAMALLQRGIVKLREAPAPESKMAEPEEAEVSHPVASGKKGKK